MCEEKLTKKVCKVCGKELSLYEFKHHARSKDGYTNTCRNCTNKKLHDGNPLLSQFTPRELIEELRVRGYRGTLTYTHIVKVKI